MTRNVFLHFDPATYAAVNAHLFQKDECEHAGALLCGWVVTENRITLTVREFIPAIDGVDYVVSENLHGRLQPLFIDEVLTRAADRGLAYLAIHNHFSAEQVAFSHVDFASHEYGYPTLLQLNEGLPVGAAVFGTDSVEVDLWMPGGARHQLATARVVGTWVRHLWASPRFAPSTLYEEEFDRQLPFLRNGQGIVRTARLGIVGLGGLGSQLLEALVRMGFRHFVLMDPDHLERSNYPRVHGALLSDLPQTEGQLGTAKVQIGKRLITQIAPDAEVAALEVDVSRGDAYKDLLECDFVFLAADTAEARLTCNALAHQFFMPMVQLGTKIQVDSRGSVLGAFGAVRHIRPGRGCLWCNGLIDRVQLANAGKSVQQRENERYGVKLPNPAVNTFNAEVAARGLNEFLVYYAAPASETLIADHDYTLIDLLNGEREPVEATASDDCPFCSVRNEGSAIGMGAAHPVPVASA